MPISTIDSNGLTNPLTSGVTTNTITSAASTALTLKSAGTTAVTIDTSQNVGIGGTPKSTGVSGALEFGPSTIGLVTSQFDGPYFTSNLYYSSGWKYASTGYASMYAQYQSQHKWYTATSGSANGAVTLTQAMTLDASGNVGIGGSPENSTQRLYVQGNKSAEGANSNDGFIKFTGNTGVSQIQFMRIDSGNYNAAACAISMGRNSSTLRSINAGGTINASGADYAEYMTKCGDFTVAKGDVIGIDANGKLTNVFADAISFVVKSTDPSYVGADTWGVELEGDKFEKARQQVDRIAFAGQVPVNVTGATAGQYIIPINDNGAIKGEAVSNPTFGQYQIAVGKVIAIESDGRAKIIVKVA